jgi:catechol 2,3-dioxygenase-like lactoylglutathione lyase family enzyme
MNIQFITSVAVITDDVDASRRLYIDALGLPLHHGDGDDYEHSEHIEGLKHFGVWPLRQAAQACFGTDTWPADRVVPQASIEFELDSAEAITPAADELARAGHTMLHPARLEPWGQTVARLISPENVVIGISYAPSLH